jgi:hypothetical protein
MPGEAWGVEPQKPKRPTSDGIAEVKVASFHARPRAKPDAPPGSSAVALGDARHASCFEQLERS